jgi:hypothetical protein
VIYISSRVQKQPDTVIRPETICVEKLESL